MVLKDKVVIVTGAGRGIGRAIAIEFARHGSMVICCARSDEDLQETASLINKANGQCLLVPTDVADKNQIHRLVEQAIKQFGHIDILVNNAARIPVISGLWDVDPDAWWDELTVDLRGPMLFAHAVLPHMIKQNSGIIINMAGGTNIPGRTSYCCSKVALNRLTILLARELQSIGSSVIVFDIGPGLVKTRRTLHEAQSEQGIKWNPATKLAFESGQDRPPEDCARAMVKLVGNAGPELSGKSFSTADVLAE